VLDPTFRNHLGELDEKLKGVDPKFHVPRQQYEGLLMEATRALHARTTRGAPIFDSQIRPSPPA
jgi:hypothetical protein